MNTRLLLRNGYIWLIFLSWTAFCLPCGYVLAIVCRIIDHTTPHTLMRRGIYWYGRLLLFFISPAVPTQTIRKQGIQNCQRILILNHQSMLDIYLIGLQSCSNICLVSKSWPYRLLFFFSPMMRAAQYIDAERLDAQTVFARCQKRLEEGATLVFYPEGRRSRDGGLQRFHAGAFYLAARLGIGVTPIVIHNSFRILPPQTFLFQRGTLVVEILPDIHPQDFQREPVPHRSMMRATHAVFKKHLAQRSLS